MTTTTANPYSAPSANMEEGTEETYQPKIFTIDGRIGRLRYLAYGMAWNAVILGAAFVLSMVAVFGVGEEAMAVTMVLGYGATLVPVFILAVRRLNDMDTSGWLSLLLIVPIVNAIFGLVLLFAPGTKGPNQYGPAPVQNSTGVIVAALTIPVLMVVGILAAVSIPAYQDYVERAEAQQVEQLERQE